MTEGFKSEGREEERRLRLLLVEDSEDDAALLLLELGRGGFSLDWRRVDTREGLENALADPWELVIADFSLPRFDGLEALEILKRRDEDLPCIMVSGVMGEEVAVKAMLAGARDYVMKENLSRLCPAIRRELREVEMRGRRKAAEAALRRSEEQLRQAQKMEAIGRLAGGIAHDFNNVLTAIIGYAELLRAKVKVQTGDEPREIGEIEQAAGKARALIRQLLAFSRRQLVHLRPLDLNEVVADLEKLLFRLVGDDVKIVTELEPGLPPVLGDSGQMDQVLMNLVVNAHDAMPGGGLITIKTGRAALKAEDFRPGEPKAPGDYVRLSVQDTGLGMSAEVLEHLFEPFFTTKGEGRGTGLGLSTLYGIVKQGGGLVRVKSREGEGARFDIFLPVCEGEDSSVLPAGVEEGAPPAGATILLVEDETSLRQLMAEVLGARGYRVLKAPDGRDALRLAADPALSIDLLLTDVIMKPMSGPELIRELRRSRPDLPVLFISGYAPEHFLKAADLRVKAEFLDKPFTPASLLQKVAAALRLK